MPFFVDQLQRSVEINTFPKKIISLVPSQTELLFFLGLDAEIAAVTRYCTRPGDKVGDMAKIEGTKQLNIPAIHVLQPDLIIANKEENEQLQIEELAKHYPVWVSDVNNLFDAIGMIRGIGQICNRVNEAGALIHAINQQFSTLHKSVNEMSVAYFIWRKPYMVAGQDTFINSMLQLCGFKNAFTLNRYPMVSAQELAKANPNVILLSSEPYPFSEKHKQEIGVLLPNAKVLLVNGELFSWYGSRLLEAPSYFNSLLAGL